MSLKSEDDSGGKVCGGGGVGGGCSAAEVVLPGWAPGGGPDDDVAEAEAPRSCQELLGRVAGARGAGAARPRRLGGRCG